MVKLQKASKNTEIQLYLSPWLSKKGTSLSVSPNIYALSIPNLKLNSDLRFAEIGHEEGRAHNEGIYTRFHNVRVYMPLPLQVRSS